jgi:peptidoglycan/LPS O-acetylase OafA/YrhL
MLDRSTDSKARVVDMSSSLREQNGGNAGQAIDASLGRYPALDGLRGIAILAVFLSHYAGGHKSKNFIIHCWSIVADSGWMGVDLFFVLSGFLITGILFQTASDEHRVKNFYARRALRIFPLFYGVLFGFLLLTPVLNLHWQPGHLLYFFYLSNMMSLLAPHLASPGAAMGVAHLWSLAVEEQFYLLWPFVVWSVRNRKHLLKISYAIIIASLSLRIILVWRGVDSEVIYELLFTRADSLIAGGILALLVRGPLARKLPVKPILLCSWLAVAAMFFITGSGRHEGALLSTIGYSVIAVFCACLVYSAWLGEGWIARIANHAWLRFFGRYSYGLYIFHGLFVTVLFPLVYTIQRLLHSVVWGGLYI